MTALEQRRACLVVEREHAEGCQERPTFDRVEPGGIYIRFSCPMCGAAFLFREAALPETVEPVAMAGAVLAAGAVAWALSSRYALRAVAGLTAPAGERR